VIRTLGSNLKYIYTRPLLINALRTNGNYAEQLCKTRPDSYYGAIGAAIKTGYMSPSDEANRVFYNNNYRMPELLFSDWVSPPPETRFIMNYVTNLTR